MASGHQLPVVECIEAGTLSGFLNIASHVGQAIPGEFHGCTLSCKTIVVRCRQDRSADRPCDAYRRVSDSSGCLLRVNVFDSALLPQTSGQRAPLASFITSCLANQVHLT